MRRTNSHSLPQLQLKKKQAQISQENAQDFLMIGGSTGVFKDKKRLRKMTQKSKILSRNTPPPQPPKNEPESSQMGPSVKMLSFLRLLATQTRLPKVQVYLGDSETTRGDGEDRSKYSRLYQDL